MRRRLETSLLAGLFAIGALLAPIEKALASQTNRYAVVVGNQDYDFVGGLENAQRDATDFAEMLRTNGYHVFDGYNLSRKDTEDLLRQAVINIPEGSEIVFYYSGHGIQLGRRNYLLPTDAAFQSIYDMSVQSVTLDRVIELLSSRGKTHVAIIDACRENPFPDVEMAVDLDASLFETKAGFDIMATPINSLVAFSTSPGMLAYDGPVGENSPYTEALLSLSSERRGDSFTNVLAGVREKVYQSTEGRQVPWESSTLVQPFMLLPESAVLTPQPPVSEAPKEVAATEPSEPVTDEAPQRGADTSEPPAIINVSVDLEATFDREVSLTGALLAATGAGRLSNLTVTEDPAQGLLAVVDQGSGLLYRPTFNEVRATSLSSYLHSDTTTIQFTDGAQEYRVDATIDLFGDDCDVQAGDALDPQGVGLFRLPNELNVARALAACTVAWEENPDTPRFLYQLGRAQQANGEIDKAFASFSQAADAGHIRAYNAKGHMLFTRNINRDTTSVPLDPQLAGTVLKQGIAGGDAFAMHTQGQRLLRTGETEALRSEGFELMDRAAELGHTYSMNELGYYFLDRDSDHYLPERGMTYLRASAARNDIYGYNNLGLVALYGLDGNPKDLSAAYDWFEKAALGGHPFAPGNLGRMIFNDQAPGKTSADALRWNDMGLERGDGWAGANGAALILNRGAGGLDAPEALVRYAKAVHLPSQDAAEQSRSRLSRASKRDLGKALQLVLNDLGANIGVDGLVGPATLNSMRAITDRNGLGPIPSDPQARLLLATKAYWAERPTRPDLF